jgi:hypothetical protein
MVHCDGEPLTVFDYVVHGNDARIANASERSSFSQAPFSRGRRRQRIEVHNLESYFARQALLHREPDRGGTALAQWAKELESRDLWNATRERVGDVLR